MGSHAREILLGLVCGLASVGLAALLEGSQRTDFAGVLLVAVAAIYFGFAVADGRLSAIAAQALSAMTFGMVAYLGVQLESHALLGAGYAAHAAWDALHHGGRGFTTVRAWYPPWCAVIDLTIAVPLLAGWL